MKRISYAVLLFSLLIGPALSLSAREGGRKKHSERGAAIVVSGKVLYHGQITSRSSRKCLDINAPKAGAGAYAQQWNCSQQGNQRWKVVDLGGNEFVLQLEQGGLVLDVTGGSRENGALVQQMLWNKSSSQRWRLRRMPGGAFELVNESSGKCLGVKLEQESQNGARIQMWDCYGGNNQQWLMR